MSNKKIREAFEKEIPYSDKSKYSDGTYVNDVINDLWEGCKTGIRVALTHQAESDPVGHFYNRPHEGRIGVEWCCDHLDDGSALYTVPQPAAQVPDGWRKDIERAASLFRQCQRHDEAEGLWEPAAVEQDMAERLEALLAAAPTIAEKREVQP